MSTTQPILCPKCGRADAVRKVSAIVSKESWSSETAGIGLGLGDRSLDLTPFVGTSTSRSALAAILVPPAKPAEPLGYGWTAIFTLGRLALALFLGLLLSGATLCSFPLLINTYSANRMLILVPLTILVLFIVASLVWMSRSAIQDVRAIRTEQDKYEARLGMWRRASERWQHLYYCERDDGVFVLHEPTLIPLQRAKDFINADGKKAKLAI